MRRGLGNRGEEAAGSTATAAAETEAGAAAGGANPGSYESFFAYGGRGLRGRHVSAKIKSTLRYCSSQVLGLNF